MRTNKNQTGILNGAVILNKLYILNTLQKICILCFFIISIIMFSTVLKVKAEEMSAYDETQAISISINTDKESYEYDDNINMVISQLNVSKDCENVDLKIKLSGGIKADDETILNYHYDKVSAGDSSVVADINARLVKTLSGDDINSGEDTGINAGTDKADINNSNNDNTEVSSADTDKGSTAPGTNDNNDFIIWAVLIIVSLGVLIVVSGNNKKLKKILSVMLVSAIALGSVADTQYVYAETVNIKSDDIADINAAVNTGSSENIKYSVIKNINVSGNTETIEVTVSIGKVSSQSVKKVLEVAQLECNDIIPLEAKNFTVNINCSNYEFADNIDNSAVVTEGVLSGMTIENVIRIDDNNVAVQVSSKSNGQEADIGKDYIDENDNSVCGLEFEPEAFKADGVEAQIVLIEQKQAQLELLASDITSASYIDGVIYIPVNIKYAEVIEADDYSDMFYFKNDEYTIESVKAGDSYIVGIRTGAVDIDTAVNQLQGRYLCVKEDYINCPVIEKYIYELKPDVRLIPSYLNHLVTEYEDTVAVTLNGEISLQVDNGKAQNFNKDNISLKYSDGSYGVTTIDSIENIEGYNAVNTTVTTTFTKEEYENVKEDIANNDFGYAVFELTLADGCVMSNWGSKVDTEPFIFSYMYNQLGGDGDILSDLTPAGIAAKVGEKILGAVGEKLYNKITHTPDMKDLGNDLKTIISELNSMKTEFSDIKQYLTQSEVMLGEMSRQLKANRYETIMINFENYNNDIKGRTQVIMNSLKDYIGKLNVKADDIQLDNGNVIDTVKAADYIEAYDNMLENIIYATATNNGSDNYVEKVIKLGNVITGDTAGAVYGSKSFIQSFDDYYYGVTNYNFDMQNTDEVNAVRTYMATIYAQYYAIAKLVVNYNINTADSEAGRSIYKGWEEVLDTQYNQVKNVIKERGSDGRIYCIPMNRYYNKTLLVKNFSAIGIDDYNMSAAMNPGKGQLAELARRSGERQSTIFKDIVQAGFIFGGDYQGKNIQAYTKEDGSIDEYIKKYGDISDIYVTASDGNPHYTNWYDLYYYEDPKDPYADKATCHKRVINYPSITTAGVDVNNNVVSDYRVYTTCTSAYYYDERGTSKSYHEVDYVRTGLSSQHNGYASWLQQIAGSNNISINQVRDALGVFNIVEAKINSGNYIVYDYYYYKTYGNNRRLEAIKQYRMDNIWSKIDIGIVKRGARSMLFFQNS